MNRHLRSPAIATRRDHVFRFAGVFLFATFFLFGLSACAPEAKEASQRPSGLNTSRHDFVGVVVSADEEAKEAIIDHETIPGVMGAMRMGFSVPEGADREKLRPGARIKATLVVENATMWVEEVEVTGQGDVPSTEPPVEKHSH